MAAEVQAGLALMDALDDAQQAAARVQRPNELWAGAGKDGVPPPLEGSSVAGWSEAQRAALLDAVALWVGLLPAPSAEERLAEIEADLADTHFAWHGDVDAGRPIYYRIQGPALIIEFATQSSVRRRAGALPLDLSRSRPTNTERPRSTLADRRPLARLPSSLRRMPESSPVRTRKLAIADRHRD